VDDASTDDTAEVVARWSDRGVRYLRVNHHDPRQSRLSGLQATSAEFVSFLDADDRLAPDYLRGGLAGFDRYDVGIVYSDVDYFGDWNRCHQEPEEITLSDMGKLNYVHNGSIVRREALEMSRALEVPFDSRRSHEDWLAWRRILEQGWKAKKQRGIYGYRRHESNRTNSKYKTANYFNQRAMETETVTLFVALSGRTAVWPRFQQFLEQQTWPHSQMKLWLLDTSQDDRFGRRIRRWISQCDYADVRYRTEAAATRRPGWCSPAGTSPNGSRTPRSRPTASASRPTGSATPVGSSGRSTATPSTSCSMRGSGGRSSQASGWRSSAERRRRWRTD
jgi:glycosyltransferase involved in cell wall biosynthesis